jgi:hypothetical protein
MPKQRLEGILSKSLKKTNYWYLKLQSNKLTHQTMPADFIVLPNENMYRFLIECKETKSDRFSFDRLTQLDSLKSFKNSSQYNFSYLLLMFWKGRLKKSFVYIIDIESLDIIMKIHKYKSLSIEECEEYSKAYSIYKINIIEDNLLDLKNIW